jgi:hypothetical protein
MAQEGAIKRLVTRWHSQILFASQKEREQSRINLNNLFMMFSLFFWFSLLKLYVSPFPSVFLQMELLSCDTRHIQLCSVCFKYLHLTQNN